jgi:YVTN family beta-propeller protein/autotransporter-associated beta strand protein
MSLSTGEVAQGERGGMQRCGPSRATSRRAVTATVMMVVAMALGLAPIADAQVTGIAVVPNGTDGSVSMIFTASGTVGLTPSVGNTPTSVAVSPDGRLAYVATGTEIVPVRVGSGFTLPAIAPGSNAIVVVLTPDGRRAYFSDATAVSPIDLTTNVVGSAILTGNAPIGLAMAPDGQHVYVVNAVSNTLSVIDTATDTVSLSIPVGSQPQAVVVTPDGLTAYVTNRGSDSVSVVDLTAGTVVTTIPTGVAPQTLAITPDGATLFVFNVTDNTLSVIDTSTNTAGTPIALTSALTGMAVTPDGQTLYGIDRTNNAVIQIDVAARTLLPGTIAVGQGAAAAGNFMSPPLVIPSGPLVIASDADLTARGFGSRFVDFYGGVLKLSGNWTTSRTLSVLAADGTLQTDGHDATVAGAIIGDGHFFKEGAGTLTLTNTATATQTGGTRVFDGVLQVDGQHTADINLFGGTLRGSGTVGQVATPGGGMIRPGSAAATGVLTMANLINATGVQMMARINGPVPGAGHDALHATGTANLAGAGLTVTIDPAVTTGDPFIIVTNTVETFTGIPEGTPFFETNGRVVALTYHAGASGHDVGVIFDHVPTISAIADQTIPRDTTLAPIAFTVGDDLTAPAAIQMIGVTSSDHDLLLDSAIVIGGSGASRTLTATPVAGKFGSTTITVVISDGLQFAVTSFQLFVSPDQFYYLAEGATGSFFDTEIAIVNPNNVLAPYKITFLKSDGTTVVWQQLLDPTSRLTFPPKFLAGLESAEFSTVVDSMAGMPLLVERTMWWDSTGYGAHGEKASAGPAAEWFFAEGSQGYFHTYFLLLNPQAVANVAHVTYLLDDGSTVARDYPLAASSRRTIDAGSEDALINRSFGAHVVFDLPGMTERAMYFGSDPLFSGGHDSAGVTAPATSWFLAEGATGSYFDTFVLVANPNNTETTATMTYLPASGLPVTKTHVLAPHQRLTVNIADEDPTLASAAVATSVASTQPVIVERSQYWPHGNWYEAHNSAGETAAGTKWGLAEGRVGGDNHAQTYILLANPGTAAANVTVSFMHSHGNSTPLVKTFTVAPTSRLNIAVTGPDSDVPELQDEEFGAVIESTQPIMVERSMYSDANGVVWAAGTNVTGIRMP